MTLWQNATAGTWTLCPAPNQAVLVDGVTHAAQCPDRPAVWGLTCGSEGVARFEVRPGYGWSGDTTVGVERSELSSTTRMPFGTGVWVSFAMRVRSPLPSSWVIAGQFHASPDADDVQASPPFAQQFTAGTFQVLTRSSTEDPLTASPSAVTRHSELWEHDTDEWVNFVYRLRFSRGAPDAELQMWKNGTELVNLAGIAMGYNDVNGPYYKFGIYRSTATDLDTAIEYANVQVGTASLLDRVVNPLPTPT